MGIELIGHSAFPPKSSCRFPAIWPIWADSICFWWPTAGVVGCNVGSAIAYWIGAKGGRPLVERYGKWVLMSQHDLDLMARFFERYGSIAILAGAHDASGANLCSVSGRHRQNVAAALSHLHHNRIVDLVLLPGVDRHEAGTELEYRSAIAGSLPSLSSCGGTGLWCCSHGFSGCTSNGGRAKSRE